MEKQIRQWQFYIAGLLRKSLLFRDFMGYHESARSVSVRFACMEIDQDFCSVFPNETVMDLIDAISDDMDITIPSLGRYAPRNCRELVARIEAELRRLRLPA